MRLLDRLQRRFGRFAVPHVTEGLIACQALTYVLLMGNAAFLEKIALIPNRVLEGEVWRLVTFLCQTPPMHPVFAFFFWYFFYLMGTALESTWGTFRYNVYLLAGWAATVAAAFLQPDQAASIIFLQGSIFLAFAYLFPDFQILLFFILPVKVKWLALLQWIGYGAIMLTGTPLAQVLVTASVFNYLLFFWHDIWLRARSGRRRMARQAEHIRSAKKPLHVCVVCGATNLTHPNSTFRYCSRCTGSPCYCEEHLHNHEHRQAVGGCETS